MSRRDEREQPNAITNRILDDLIRDYLTGPGINSPFIFYFQKTTLFDQLPGTLMVTAMDGRNMLMLAAQYEPPAVVTSILTAVDSLLEQERISVLVNMLTVTATDGRNALMLAAQYQPPAVVTSILTAVDSLPEEERTSVLVNMLTVTATDGRNALMLAAQYQPDAVDGILSRYTIDMIATDASLDETLLTLKDSEARQRVFSLREFIKPNQILSAKQLQVVKNWFSEAASKEEKTTLLRIKPTQVGKLVLDEKERGIALETKVLQLLLLLNPSAEVANSQIDFVSDAIKFIYNRLLKEQGEVKTAAQSVMQIYNSKSKPLKSSRPSVLVPRKGKAATEANGMELDSLINW